MEKKLILGLCTSGSRLKVAVAAGDRFYSAQKKIFNQERAMFGMVRRQLGRAGENLRSVAALCAARGPGRFTGIRIALTLAGTLRALAGVKVYTATAFEILALQAFEHKDFTGAGRPGRLAVLLHAFKEEYFCQFFKTGNGVKLPRAESEPVWLKADEMRQLLAAQPASFHAVADEEESPGIYALLPAQAARACPAVSKVLPAYIIKAAMAYGSATLKPLYLKPAKYELENPKTKSRESGVGCREPKNNRP
jgi:tRNA threonylcarbamoyl adenosine modification protein YeaZ